MKLDLRSLALFRICLGLLVLVFFFQLAPDFDVFYRRLSSHVTPDFLIEGIFWSLPLWAAFLLVGFLTRLSTFLCWLGIVVLQQVNPQILQGGDVLLRLLLFWAFFLPIGASWSIDTRWRRESPAPWPWPLTTSLASWALALQVVQVYWSAALLKSDPLWTQSGNALFYALNIEHFTTPLGLHLRQYSELLRVLSFGTLTLEFIGPLLLFIPFHRQACRMTAVVLFVGFHLVGMQALLRIGLFPWVCATAWLVFLPGSFWDQPASLQERILKIKKSKPHRRGPVHPKHEKPTPTARWLDHAYGILVAISLLDVTAWNIASLDGGGARSWMERHDALGKSLRLEQHWNMYAPFPRAEHGWLVVPAELADDRQIDLFTGQTVSWEKPSDIGAYFGNDRWRRYLSNLFDERDPQALDKYAEYLVGNWNQQHPPDQKVQTVTIVFMKQVTQTDLTVTAPEKDVLYFHVF